MPKTPVEPSLTGVSSSRGAAGKYTNAPRILSLLRARHGAHEVGVLGSITHPQVGLGYGQK